MKRSSQTSSRTNEGSVHLVFHLKTLETSSLVHNLKLFSNFEKMSLLKPSLNGFFAAHDHTIIHENKFVVNFWPFILCSLLLLAQYSPWLKKHRELLRKEIVHFILVLINSTKLDFLLKGS